MKACCVKRIISNVGKKYFSSEHDILKILNNMNGEFAVFKKSDDEFKNKIVSEIDGIKNTNVKIISEIDEIKKSNVKIISEIDEIKNTNNKIISEIDEIKKSNVKIISEIDEIKKSNAEIKKKIVSYEPVWNKAGRTYELAVKERVRRIYGDQFAESFKIQNLLGLARFSLPLNKDLECTGEKDIFLHMSRATKLYEKAIINIESLKKWADENSKDSSNQYLYKKAKIFLAEFSKFEKAKDQKKYMITQPLGFFLFSTNCLSDMSKKGYISEIEVDIRGSIVISGDNIQYIHGEIKSGNQRKEGIVQLLRTQSIYFHSLNAIAGKLSPIKPFFKGIIFCDSTTWKEPDALEIKKYIDEEKLILPEYLSSMEIMRDF